ncbi:alpha/beta fold hydrolase [Cupriavidus metallidurans]|nr:alpha/beta hydrolase [Cupriavidus metallidurans]AVA38191.1 alpha/beta hydrolase [Cupriavidus metallidurans]QGS27524.1 alpha/beta fold hydrolase [Cupriavidus metallidurans]
MPCDERMYAAQVSGLSDLTECRVMVVDAQSFDAGAEHLLTSIHGRFIIAGTAYGGCLAIETAIRAPERVAGLWLMNCNPGAHPDLDAVRETSFRLRSGQLDQVLEEFATAAMPDTAADCRTVFIEMGRVIGAEVFARQSDAALTRRDHWDKLSSIVAPTLITWGMVDRFLPTGIGEEMARLMPHAQLDMLEGCGHFPSLEQPLLTTALARNWLLKHQNALT